MKDVIIIGGGQAALACAYFLRRTNIDYIMLDNQEAAGGAWHYVWDSLILFSPSKHSSLPGWMMPPSQNDYPTKEAVLEYLKNYENRYQFPIERPVFVEKVIRKNDYFEVHTSKGMYTSKAIISATGSWSNPYLPKLEGIEQFKGLQLHSAYYSNPDDIEGTNVLIVGGGNSAAQILAELSSCYSIQWLVQHEPEFLPEEVDGKYLFDFATLQYEAKKQGKSIGSLSNLGNIVQLEKVKKAKAQGLYDHYFTSCDSIDFSKVDTIIYCTGFKASLQHLTPLNLYQNGRINVNGTKATGIDGLWLVGYGNWTGFASATLIGVGRTAKSTIQEIENYLSSSL